MKLVTLFLFLGTLHATAAPLKVLPPSEPGQVYHGAFTDNGPLENTVTVESIEKFESLVGKKVAWVYFSDHWLEGKVTYPAASIDAIKKTGSIPYIRMSPWSDLGQNKADPIISMQKIIDGQFDEDLKKWAQYARDSGTPIMIEFGPEANGKWFPWNGTWNGGSKKNGYGDPNWPDGPERYRDAYRHVVDLFKKEGAENITWILHIDTSQDPNVEWNDPKYYYPGDNYIDWIGLTVYGRQLPEYDWDEFVPKINGYLKKVNAVSKTKPLMISEYAVIEDAKDVKRKAKWISDALNFVLSKKIPRLYAATYWHSPGWLPDGKANFKVDSSTYSLKAYQDAISDNRWIWKTRLSQ